MKHESLDLMCLRALKVNAESGRAALLAASIVVHAHAIARGTSDPSHDALRIIDLVRRLHGVRPSRDELREMVDESLADIDAAGDDRARAERARDRLIDRVWQHFHRNQSMRSD